MKEEVGVLRHKEPKLNIIKRLFNNEEIVEKTEKNEVITDNLIDHAPIDEKKLENEMNSFQSIFDHLTSGIWIREELDGDLVYASKGFEEILNLPLNKIYETPSLRYQMVHPLHKKEVAANFESVAQGKKVQMLYPITDGKGQKKWLLEQIIPRVNHT